VPAPLSCPPAMLHYCTEYNQSVSAEMLNSASLHAVRKAACNPRSKTVLMGSTGSTKRSRQKTQQSPKPANNHNAKLDPYFVFEPSCKNPRGSGEAARSQSKSFPHSSEGAPSCNDAPQLQTAIAMTGSVLYHAMSKSCQSPPDFRAKSKIRVNTAIGGSEAPAAGVSPFALEAAKAQFDACSAQSCTRFTPSAPASGLAGAGGDPGGATPESSASKVEATAPVQAARTRSKRQAAVLAALRISVQYEGTPGLCEADGATSPAHSASSSDTGSANETAGKVIGMRSVDIALSEMKASHWRKHIFVKLLFVSSRSISNQLVDGRSQLGWAVILPAADALHSLSYRQRSELVRYNGSKVAIRYLLASHEKESVKGAVRRGQLRRGKHFMALSAAWFDVIDVEAIVEAGKGLFTLSDSASRDAGYPMFECLKP